MRAFAALALALAFASGSLALDCNGHTELCDRKYSNVTFVGAHDSSFVGISPADNQLKSVTDQLSGGIRYLTAQTHKKDNAIELCHTLCLLLDAGPLQNYLSDVKAWMDDNPNEVVTLLLTNQDAIDVNKFADAFKTAGLDTYAYTPGEELTMDEWPTLGTMVSNKQRLVVFMDYHADTSKVPWILDEFKYYFETPFDTTDKNFPQCTLDRPKDASPDGRMYIVNHYLDIEVLPGVLVPNRDDAGTTNSVASILAQTDLCYSQYKRTPNVVLLDWVSMGDAMKAQDDLNNLG
ncbi:PI-PLC X domain-containing protein 1 [Apiospora marii]|uniref:PI-PLC X domain-containing protein 1 n=1 Tax=Apiospora marii TaxID=335849 RepID=A0ABR1SS85_9PEZI